MRIQFKPRVLQLIPESEAEASELATWKARHDGFVFALAADGDNGARLTGLGPRPQACREPINVYSANRDPRIRIIANFAPTPFTLDGMHYACVEAFWQSLRFPPEERAHRRARRWRGQARVE